MKLNLNQLRKRLKKLPKLVESFRHKQGNSNVVRILHTRPFLDSKWLKGITVEDLKKYMVVKYSITHDKHLPIWNIYDGKKVQWWDNETHASLKSGIVGYDTNNWERKKKDSEKIKKAATEFNKADFTYFHTDDWEEAQNKYIEWCADDGVEVSVLYAGKNEGDD